MELNIRDNPNRATLELHIGEKSFESEFSPSVSKFAGGYLAHTAPSFLVLSCLDRPELQINTSAPIIHSPTVFETDRNVYLLCCVSAANELLKIQLVFDGVWTTETMRYSLDDLHESAPKLVRFLDVNRCVVLHQDQSIGVLWTNGLPCISALESTDYQVRKSFTSLSTWDRICLARLHRF
jgi:hypothetical protein